MASVMAIDASQQVMSGVVSPPLQVSPQQTPPPSYELIPHRVFVGGLPHGQTVESELRTFFEEFGSVRDVKIIRNFDGTTKFGFVTYESEEEAKAVRNLPQDQLEFKGRRLNIGPAMRKVNPNPRGVQDLAVASPLPYMVYAPVQMINADPYGQVQSGGGQTYTVMVPSTPVQQQPYGSFQFNSPSYTPGPTPPVAPSQQMQQQTRFMYNGGAVNYGQMQGVMQQTPNSVHTPQLQCQTPRLSQSGSSANLVETGMLQQAVPNVMTTSNSNASLSNMGQGQGMPGTPVYSMPGTMQQTNMYQQQANMHTPITPSSTYRYANPSQVNVDGMGQQMYQYQMVNQPTTYYAPLDMTHYSQMVPQQPEYVSAVDYNNTVPVQHEVLPYYCQDQRSVFFQSLPEPGLPEKVESMSIEEGEIVEEEGRKGVTLHYSPRSPLFIETPEKKRKMKEEVSVSSPVVIPRVRLTPLNSRRPPREVHGYCSPLYNPSSMSKSSIGSVPFPSPSPGASPYIFNMSPFQLPPCRSAPPKIRYAQNRAGGRVGGRSPRKPAAVTSLVNQLNQAAINDPLLSRTPLTTKYTGHGMKVQLSSGSAQLLETTVNAGGRKDKGMH